MTAERSVVALGSNLDDPVQQLLRAFDALAGIAVTRLLARSSLYRNAPLGPQGQPDYVNAVALLETRLAPHALLDALQAIEHGQGRVRAGERWGPRTLDLDILLFGGRVLNDERLVVPHPGLRERPFFLVPLQEVAPGLEVPGLGPLAELVKHAPAWRMERVEEAS